MKTPTSLPPIFPARRATALEALYRQAGLAVEIEAGPVGIVIYGPSAQTVRASAASIARNAAQRDPHAAVEHVGTDEDEPEPTRWYAVVAFDWAKFAEKGAA